MLAGTGLLITTWLLGCLAMLSIAATSFTLLVQSLLRGAEGEAKEEE